MISDASKLTRGFLLSGRMKKPWVSLCPLLLCKHDLGGQGRGLDQRSVTGATGELTLQLEVDGNEPREVFFYRTSHPNAKSIALFSPTSTNLFL
jgi:hypothetical protein